MLGLVINTVAVLGITEVSVPKQLFTFPLQPLEHLVVSLLLQDSPTLLALTLPSGST